MITFDVSNEEYIEAYCVTMDEIKDSHPIGEFYKNRTITVSCDGITWYAQGVYYCIWYSTKRERWGLKVKDIKHYVGEGYWDFPFEDLTLSYSNENRWNVDYDSNTTLFFDSVDAEDLFYTIEKFYNKVREAARGN